MRNFASEKSLKEVLVEKIPQEQETVKAFRKQHGSTKVGEVTVDMVSEKIMKNKNEIKTATTWNMNNNCGVHYQFTRKQII